jgi:cell division protein FtsL
MMYRRQESLVRFFVWPLFMFVVAAGIFGVIWMRSSITSLQYRLGELKVREQKLITEKRNLLAKKENILSIGKIEQVAIKDMGFQFPDRSRVFFLKSGI